MISDVLRSLNIPFLDGNTFRQVTTSRTTDIIIKLVVFLYGVEWHTHFMSSVIVRMDCLMPTMCLFAVHVCRCTDDKNSGRCLNSLLPWYSVMVKPLTWYFLFTFFRPEIISYFPLVLYACTDLKFVFLDFVFMKGHIFTKNKYSDIYTLWWFLEMV